MSTAHAPEKAGSASPVGGEAAAAGVVLIKSDDNGPAWIDSGHVGPAQRIAFRCLSCGKYVDPAPTGQLRPHWLKLVGRDKKKLPQHQCQDSHLYSTADTRATHYLERTAAARPA